MMMKYRYFALLFLLLPHINSLAQFPDAQFSVDEKVCLNSNVSFSNTSANAISYEWDFCEGDLKTTPAATNIGTITGAAGAESLIIRKEGSNFFGFVVSRNNHKLIRLDFGADLTNIPTYVDLGNPGGLLNYPSKVEVVNESGSWYGFVTNTDATSSLIRLSFGSSLSGAPTAVSLGNFSKISSPFGLTYEKDGDNHILLVTNRSARTLVAINFGNTVTSSPNATTDVKSTQLPAGGFLREIDVIKDGDGQWFGLAVSENGNVQKLSFGTSLFTTPSVTIITSNFPAMNFPADVQLAIDKGHFVSLISGGGGNIYRLDFGEQLSSDYPDFTDFGTFGFFNLILGIDLVKTESKWFMFGVNGSISTLVRLFFENTCTSSLTFSTAVNPTGLSFSSPGFQRVSLTAFDADGNSDYKLDSVLVNRGPTPLFSTDLTCSGTGTLFFDNSQVDFPVSTYQWDFGDPSSGADNTSSLQNPSHIYSLTGDYTVTLSITDDCGEVNSTSEIIHIYDSNDLQPDFSFSGTVCTNGEASFTNETTFTNDTPIEWSWNFGGLGTSSEENPSFIFSDPNDYEITLTVTGISGCSKSLIQSISVITGPIPSFTVNDDCLGKPFQFTNSSTGDIATYHWDFGNGFTSSLANPSFQYGEPGSYSVALTLTSSLGCMSEISQLVTVFELPEVSFINDLACEGSSTQFTDQTTIGDANISTWSWNFDDPASGDDTSLDRNPSHVFSSSGNFDVKLAAQTTNGCRDSVTQVVKVLPAPQAAFDYDKLCINQNVQFQDISEPVAGENITSWGWDLGGVFSTEQNPKTTFEFAKDYNIGLTVRSENLCSSTVYKTITITPVPHVIFGVEDACDNTEVHFYDTTDPLGVPIVTRSWNFADLATQTDSSTYYQFPQAGIYTVRLGITTQNGCEYFISDQVQVHAAPTAAFKTPITFGAPPLEIPFVNESVNAATYQWFFGDGATSVEAEPVHTFLEEGRHEIELIATDVNGCSDSTSRAINVVDPDLELELSHLFPVENSGGTKLVMMLKNNGTIIIDSIQVSIDLGSQLSASELIKTTIMPGQQVNVPLNLSFVNRSLDFVCVTAEALVEGVEEIITTNNSRCINFEDDIVILKPYPNPGNGFFHLTVVSNETGSLSLQLISPKGNVVKDLIVNSVGTGYNDIVVDISDVAGGLYIMKATYKGKTEIFRMMIHNGFD